MISFFTSYFIFFYRFRVESDLFLQLASLFLLGLSLHSHLIYNSQGNYVYYKRNYHFKIPAMKFPLLFLLLFVSATTFCQDTTILQQSWANLKAQFLLKSEAAKNFAILASDSKQVESASAEKAIDFSLAIMQVLRISQQPDKALIARLTQINDSLNVYLYKIAQQLKTDKRFILLKSYAAFKKNLQSTLTKLYVLKHDYNTACKEADQTDLAFPADKEDISF